MKLLKAIGCLAVLSAAVLSANAQTANIDSIDYYNDVMTISGSPDATWDVQSSEDGTNWTTLGSATLSGGTATFSPTYFDSSLYYRLYDDSATNDQGGTTGYMWVTVNNAGLTHIN